MQRATFFVPEIVAFIVMDKLHYCAFRQGGWLVKNETPILDARSYTTHRGTVTVFPRDRQLAAVYVSSYTASAGLFQNSKLFSSPQRSASQASRGSRQALRPRTP